MNDFYFFFRIFWTLFSKYSLTFFSAFDTSVSIFFSFCFFEISYRSENAFLFRKIVKTTSNSYFHENDLKVWANQIDLILESLISSMRAKIKILKLLWQYRHLNSENFSDLSLTNLIIHRVQFQSKTKSSSKFQRKMIAHKEWWFRKLIQKNLKENVYELLRYYPSTLLIHHRCLSHALMVPVTRSDGACHCSEASVIWEHLLALAKKDAWNSVFSR